MIEVLRGLVEYYCEHRLMPGDDYAGAEDDLVRTAVTYVGGRTDRFAFDMAEQLMGSRPPAPWHRPRGLTHPAVTGAGRGPDRPGRCGPVAPARRTRPRCRPARP